MSLIINFLVWTAIAFIGSFFDKTPGEVRGRFLFMMIMCSIVSYFLFVR